MADIFLSYARANHSRAAHLLDAFSRAQWSVFIDTDMKTGVAWQREIEQALRDCKCVVVLWSTESVNSNFVIAEAGEGLHRNILVPVQLDGTQPPLFFRGVQSAQLADWNGDESDPRFRKFLGDVASHLAASVPPIGRQHPRVPSAVTPGEGWRTPALIAAAAISLTIAAAIAAFLMRGAFNPNGGTARSVATSDSPSSSQAPLPTSGSAKTSTPIRFRTDAWNLPDEPLLGFVEIPPGAFTMGTPPADDSDINEIPEHRLTLPRYYMSRYEATVGQFSAFVKAAGYTATEASLTGGNDFPAHHVNWHAARTDTTWLDAQIRQASSPAVSALRDLLMDQSSCRITLPSEPEWEKAARGTDGRIYPWGPDLDETRSNYKRLFTSSTRATRVGAYPAGASPYGLLDMSGNVWEWTRSLWGPEFHEAQFVYPYKLDDPTREDDNAPDAVLRVMRGGSFISDALQVRSAQRFGHLGELDLDVQGFRVVLSCGARVSAAPPPDANASGADFDAGGPLVLTRAEVALFGPRPTADPARASWRRCYGGNLSDCVGLGDEYQSGKSVSKNRMRARALFKKACDGGDEQGCSSIATSLIFDGTSDAEAARGREMLKQQCLNGNETSCNLQTSFESLTHMGKTLKQP